MFKQSSFIIILGSLIADVIPITQVRALASPYSGSVMFSNWHQILSKLPKLSLAITTRENRYFVLLYQN